MTQRKVNILCLLFIFLTVSARADQALERKSKSCDILLALGFDEGYEPKLQLSESRSLRRPILRLGKVLASREINEDALSQEREKYQRILTAYERSKIFFYLIDRPDMIWGRFFWQLYGSIYVNRHKSQKKTEAGGGISDNFFANLDNDPKKLIEVMRDLSRADDNALYVKYEAEAHIMIDFTAEDDDYEFFHGNWADRNAEHIIPLIPGAIKPFIDSDPYWESEKTNKFGNHHTYKKIIEMAVDARLPQMKEFFDWLYEREERLAYAEQLVKYSLVGLKDLQRSWEKGYYSNKSADYSINSKILFSQILGLNSDETILSNSIYSRIGYSDGARPMNLSERINWLKSLSTLERRKLRKELTSIFRSIYNTKKELAHSMGAVDDVQSSSEVVKSIDAVYEGLAASNLQVEAQVMINKIQDDLMLSVEHADGYRINSTNLESFIVNMLSEMTGVRKKVVDFRSRAAAINQHILSSAFQGTPAEIKAAVSKKENIMNSIGAIDSDLASLQYGISVVLKITRQALALYDSKMLQMTEVQKSKARHVKDIYDKFVQQSTIQIEAIQSLRDSIETETQSIDLNLIEAMTKP